MIELRPCKCEALKMNQWNHIYSELLELKKAIEIYEMDRTNKNRAEVLFEALDVITAVKTLLVTEFLDEEIELGKLYVNCKNFVRGYLLEGGGFYKWVTRYMQK